MSINAFVQPFSHKPIMVGEVLDALAPRTGGVYVDGTIGGGGHAEALLLASSPEGKLFGCDRDPAAIEAASRRLAPYGERVKLRHANFADLGKWLEPGVADGVLLDIGVSSPQLDTVERGFSFQSDGPLDMRMDPGQTMTAADLVNTTARDELARLFWELGGERDSRAFARAIVQARQERPITTTRQLAQIIERTSPRRGKRIHPATKVFQALRIAVNDELESLREGLPAAVRLLKCGGRLAVITFHSLEDQMVKLFGREQARDYDFTGKVDIPELRRPRVPSVTWVTRKPVSPATEEIERNPRSRSARLRVLEKL